jgi:hypothetical protein
MSDSISKYSSNQCENEQDIVNLKIMVLLQEKKTFSHEHTFA